MPTASERTTNKTLSGSELKELLRLDFERMLTNEGMLSDYIGYGRVAYELRLKLYLDNPINPTSDSQLSSRRASVQELELRPEIAAVSTPPLPRPSEEAVTQERALTRQIDSPNAERVRAGLPVPVELKQHDGTTITEMVKYPPQPDLGEGNVTETVTGSATVEVTK